jgi:hypothetical protein
MSKKLRDPGVVNSKDVWTMGSFEKRLETLTIFCGRNLGVIYGG